MAEKKARDLRKLLSARARRRAARGAIGAPPNELNAPEGASPTQTNLLRYSSETVTVFDPDDPGFWDHSDDLRWIDISGLADIQKISQIGQKLGLHPLTIADLFHTGQRPKTEIMPNYVQIVLKMPASGLPFEADQLTLILGENFVLSIREHARDCLDPVRKRLNDGSSRIRSSSGYLTYALIDTVIDTYFPILESYGDVTEDLEERILTKPHESSVRVIHLLKRELLEVRRALWPQREAVNALLRDDVPFIDDTLTAYLRDCSDHSFQLMDMVEVYREVSQGLVDLHLSSLSNRMNEVMKVLTIIATIFIPMTFIAGVYGMNFDRASPWNLPELSWRFGYLFALGLMTTSSSIMLIIFWRLGWIFGGRKGDQNKNDRTLNPPHEPG